MNLLLANLPGRMVVELWNDLFVDVVRCVVLCLLFKLFVA